MTAYDRFLLGWELLAQYIELDMNLREVAAQLCVDLAPGWPLKVN